jgi:hypothetical protein
LPGPGRFFRQSNNNKQFSLSLSRATLEKPMQPKYVEDRCLVPFYTVFYLMIHIKHVDITTITKIAGGFSQNISLFKYSLSPPFGWKKYRC